MLIEPVCSDSLNPYLSVSDPVSVEESLREPVPLQDEPASETVETPMAMGDGEEQVEHEGVPGVLRLLMNGHFKGVADVRLRTIFHNEIEVLQVEAMGTAVAEAAGALTELVGVPLDELISSGALGEEQATAVSELQQAFGQAVDEAVEQFKTAPGMDEEALTNGLQSAFDGLSGPLETLLAPPAPAEPVEPLSGLVVDAPVVEPSILDALKDAFDAGMVHIDEALALSSILPSLSPPRGKGVAYEKFLTIYEELKGPAELDVDAQVQAEETVGSMDAVV